MSGRLETATNIVVIIVALVIGFLFVRTYTENRSQGKVDSGPPEGFQLPSVPGYDWNTHNRSLILALRNGCHYCENSMPFYRKLVGLAQSKEISANLLAVFPDDARTTSEEIKAERLSMDAFSGVALNKMDVSGTPTVILVDSRGRVLRDWVGELSAAQEDQVLGAIENAK